MNGASVSKDKEIEKLAALNREPYEELERMKREHAEALDRIFQSPTFRLGYALSWPGRVLKGLFGT